MSIEQFTEVNISRKNIEKLEVINRIIKDYLDEGYKLTLRQLYYQLVSKVIIPNEVSEYVKLSNLLVKGRMSGLVNWDSIEDRIRVPYIPYYVFGIEDAIQDTIGAYRLDRMKNQNIYIELWVEKDALSNILKRITQKYHINLMVNRGYSSCTAMYEASKRFLHQEDMEKDNYILYLGDHDPSGLDMVRDIKNRLSQFDVDLSVEHIALTEKQIKKYKPPPNPAKIKDPRFEQYIEEHGEISWEVDALHPKILNKIITSKIDELIDIELFEEMLEQEKIDKRKLLRMIK